MYQEWGQIYLHAAVYEKYICPLFASLSVYNDSKELPTVGCGHLVVKSDGLKVGDQISLDKAKGFLKTDIANAQKAVNDLVTIPLYQYEYDALVAEIWFDDATSRGGVFLFLGMESFACFVASAMSWMN
jgi:hypothetical protein